MPTKNKKAKKAERLDGADRDGWTIHTSYHWSRMVKYSNTVKKLDYWPFTGLCRINGKRKNIKSKFVQDLISRELTE